MPDALVIANWYVERARQDDARERGVDEKPLTIMAILKLIYIAHGWHLEIFDRPLFPNRIEAWKFGPVVPDVYYAFRDQGTEITEQVPVSNGEELEPQQEKLLEEVYSIYGGLPAFQLSSITHVPYGPWDKVAERGRFYAEIPNDLIKSHYVKLRSKYIRRREKK